MSRIRPHGMTAVVDVDGLSNPRVRFTDQDGNRLHVWLNAETFEIQAGNPFGHRSLKGKPIAYQNPPEGHERPGDSGYFKTRYLDLTAKTHEALARDIREFIGDGTRFAEARKEAAARASADAKQRRLDQSNKVREAMLHEADRLQLETLGQCAADLRNLAGLPDEQILRLARVLGNLA